MGPSPLPRVRGWRRGLVSQCCSIGGALPLPALRCVRHRLQRGPRARGGRSRRARSPLGRRAWRPAPSPPRAPGRGLKPQPEGAPPPPVRRRARLPSSRLLDAVLSPRSPAPASGQLGVCPWHPGIPAPARRSHGTLQHPLGTGKGQARPGGAQPQVSVFPGRAPSGPVQVRRGPVALCPPGAARVTVALEQRPVVPIERIALLRPRPGRGPPRNQS